MRTLAVFGFLAVSAGLGACSAYTNLGDLPQAGANGDGGKDDEPHTSGGAAGSSTGHSAGLHYGGSPDSTQGGATASGGTASGGTDSSEAGSAPTAGAAGNPAGGPYEPRSGPFKMLVYGRTAGFAHESYSAGKALLSEIAAENDFEVTFTQTNDAITDSGLAAYEIVFFLNPTGDVFGLPEETAFENWMTTGGAFVGVHSAADTEYGWPFYREVIGQTMTGHGPAGERGEIVLNEDMLEFPALQGLPNPWPRVEEWFRFTNSSAWESKPGFTVLGRKAADGQPIVWMREWGNFRSFYTGIGHEPRVFSDPAVKKHLTGAILWAVRREHLLE